MQQSSKHETAAFLGHLVAIALVVVGFRYLPALYVVHPWLAAIAAPCLIAIAVSVWRD